MDDKKLRKAVVALHDNKLMYGSPDAPFWFVGLEEALGDTEDEAEGLINSLHGSLQDFLQNGARPLRHHPCHESKCPENCEYTVGEAASGYTPCLLSGNDYDALCQSTWEGYIKILLSITDGDYTLNQVKRYQKFHLADTDNTPIEKQSALLELYPLPCKRHRNTWPYSVLPRIGGLEYLSSAKTYRQTQKQIQWPKLVDLIAAHQPDYVYLASQTEFSSLLNGSQSIDVTPQSIDWGNAKKSESCFARIGNTTVFTGYHPGGGWGITNDYWRNLGQTAREFSNQMGKAA